MAAGFAMLTAIVNDEDLIQRLADKTEYLHKGCTAALEKYNIIHTVNREGSMISIHFTEAEVVDFETAAQGNNDTFKRFFHGMLNEGVYIAPSAFESWFITDALSYKDLDETISAVEKVARTL
jgi:glutamate-1-semialdehyde 2,1-aminomutase